MRTLLPKPWKINQKLTHVKLILEKKKQNYETAKCTPARSTSVSYKTSTSATTKFITDNVNRHNYNCLNKNFISYNFYSLKV